MKDGAQKIAAVDLFCGVGGLTHGLVRGGINVVAGVDVDSTCRYPFEANNSAVFVERDVEKITGSELSSWFSNSELTLLAGCAPCQPFSTYSRSGRNSRHETEWPLVSSFGRLIEQVQPDLVTMENVPQLLDHPVFQRFLASLKNYHVWWSVVDCAAYGIPQTRHRLVLLASRLGTTDLRLPVSRARVRTVRETIARLEGIRAGESHPRDPLHAASALSDLNLRRIRASNPGGSWRDWPRSLRAECHKKKSGQTYPSVYGRMEWDSAAPTITTQCFGYGNGRFGHPEQDRAISLREAAMLQTFPRHYRFTYGAEPIRFNRLGKLIGNAVPVKLGEVIARALLKHVRAVKNPCAPTVGGDSN